MGPHDPSAPLAWPPSSTGRGVSSSSDVAALLDRAAALSDRIAVMDEGRIAGIVDNSDAARTSVGRLMTGLAA